jgi:hypothetical protein
MASPSTCGTQPNVTRTIFASANLYALDGSPGKR